MEAPEKIYIDADESWHRTHSVFTERAKGDDIEYVRTDAFFEKAVAWLEAVIDNGCWIANDVGKREKDAIIEDFKKYMEGELL